MQNVNGGKSIKFDKKINRRCSLIIYHAKRKEEKKEIKEVGENLINYVKKFLKNVITCPF